MKASGDLVESPFGQDMFSPNFQILKKLGGHNRKFAYPIDAIKSISLGNRFFEPEEIREINEIKLEINLNDNSVKKSEIIDFIVKNNITVYIALKANLNEIKFKPISIIRKDLKKFEIIAK